jgi:hypothetical protein
MPPYEWTTPYMQAAQQLESRGASKHSTPGLLVWAGFAVEALHYVADVDDFVLVQADERWLGHQPEIVDLADAYAAVSLAFASTDKCAAVLGHLYLRLPGSYELALSSLRPWSRNKGVLKKRMLLPDAARRWVRRVWLDADYQTLRSAQHPMTHATMRREIHRPIGPGHAQRMTVRPLLPRAVAGVNVRELILKASDTATRHVEDFNSLLMSGDI